MAKKQDATQSRLALDSTGKWYLSSSAAVSATSSDRSRTATRARQTKQNKTVLPADANSSPSLSPTHIPALPSAQPTSAAVTPDLLNDTPPATIAPLPSSPSTQTEAKPLSPKSQIRAYRKAYQQKVRNASAATFEALLNYLSEHYPTAIWEYAALDPAPKVYRLATAAYHLISQLRHQLWPDTFPLPYSTESSSDQNDLGNKNPKIKSEEEEPPSGRTPSGLISQAKTNKGRDKSYDAVERLIEVLDSDLRPKNTKIKGLPDQKAWAPAKVMIMRLEAELREEGLAFEGEMGGGMGIGMGKGVGSDMVRNGEVYPPFLGV